MYPLTLPFPFALLLFLAGIVMTAGAIFVFRRERARRRGGFPGDPRPRQRFFERWEARK